MLRLSKIWKVFMGFDMKEVKRGDFRESRFRRVLGFGGL